MTFILPRSRTSVGSRADPDSGARGAPTPAARAGRLARSEVARLWLWAHAALTKAPRPDRAPSELQAPRRQVAGVRASRGPRPRQVAGWRRASERSLSVSPSSRFSPTRPFRQTLAPPLPFDDRRRPDRFTRFVVSLKLAPAGLWRRYRPVGPLPSPPRCVDGRLISPLFPPSVCPVEDGCP